MLVVRVDGQNPRPRPRPEEERLHLLERDGREVHGVQVLDQQLRDLLGCGRRLLVRPGVLVEGEAAAPFFAQPDPQPDRGVLARDQAGTVSRFLDRLDELRREPLPEPRHELDIVGEGPGADRRVERVAAEPPDGLPPVLQDDVLDEQVPDRQVASHRLRERRRSAGS